MRLVLEYGLKLPTTVVTIVNDLYREILVSVKKNCFCAEPILEDRFPCHLQLSKKRLFGENANQ